MASIQFYAELLPNIGQVTVSATLPSDRNDDTRVELSSNREALILSHEGRQARIPLPAPISALPKLDPTASQVRTLSFRMPIEPNTTSAPHFADNSVNIVPWSASGLSSGTCLACKNCKAVIIPGPMHAWKDLPSDSWAEMMDFWHCHKPDYTPSSSATSKGYSAGDKIKSRPGIGLVDTTAFVLAEEDCDALVVCSFMLLWLAYITVGCPP